MYNDYTINDCCCNYMNYNNNSFLINAWLGTYCFDITQKLVNVYSSIDNNFEIQRLKNQIQCLEIEQILQQQTQNLTNAISSSSWYNSNYTPMAPTYIPNCFCYSPLNQNISQIEYKEEKIGNTTKITTTKNIAIIIPIINFPFPL